MEAESLTASLEAISLYRLEGISVSSWPSALTIVGRAEAGGRSDPVEEMSNGHRDENDSRDTHRASEAVEVR